MNYYEVLSVDRHASQGQIASAYRKLAMMHHPDHNPGNRDAAAKFKAITKAFEILSTPRRRAKYDLSLANDAEVILAEVVAADQASSRRRKSRRPMSKRPASRRQTSERPSARQPKDDLFDDLFKDEVACEEPEKTLGQRLSHWLDGYQKKEWPLGHVLALPLLILLLVCFEIYCWFSSVGHPDKHNQPFS